MKHEHMFFGIYIGLFCYNRALLYTQVALLNTLLLQIVSHLNLTLLFKKRRFWAYTLSFVFKTSFLCIHTLFCTSILGIHTLFRFQNFIFVHTHVSFVSLFGV